MRTRTRRLAWKLRRSLSVLLRVVFASFMARSLSCRSCCGSKNKIDPQRSVNSEDKQFTEVEIDTDASEDGEAHMNNSQWTVPGIFKSIFHASPDNKLAVKLYGSKKELLIQKKNHEKGSKKWMVHPYSHFR